MLTRIRNAVRIEQSPGRDAHLQHPPGHRPGAQGRRVHLGLRRGGHRPGPHPALQLKYGPNGERLITKIDRISKPGRRIYRGYKDLEAGPQRHGNPDPEHPEGGHERPPRPGREGRRRSPGIGLLSTHIQKGPGAGGRATERLVLLIEKAQSNVPRRPRRYREEEGSMSRIGRKPVPVPANVKVSVADSTVQVEGPKGKLSCPYRGDITVRFDEAAREILVERGNDERQNRALHGLYPQPDRQHGQRGDRRLHQEAGDRRRRLPGAVEEGQHGHAPGRLRQPDHDGSPRGGDGRGHGPDPHHASAARTSRRSASSPPRSARSAPPSPTRARASGTRARSSAARPARRSAPSNPEVIRWAPGSSGSRTPKELTHVSFLVGVGRPVGIGRPASPPNGGEGSSGEAA